MNNVMNVLASGPNYVHAKILGLPDRIVSAPKPKPGCDLHDAVKDQGNSLLAQITNVVPLGVRWGFIIAGIMMVGLAFTGKLGRAGSIIVGVIAAVIFITIAPTLSSSVSPDKCG